MGYLRYLSISKRLYFLVQVTLTLSTRLIVKAILVTLKLYGGCYV